MSHRLKLFSVAWFFESCLLLQLTCVGIAETTVYLHVYSKALFISNIHNKKMVSSVSSSLHWCKMANGSLTQFVLDGFQDAVWVAQHAGCCRADLNEVFSHGLTQEHCIKCRYFVHSHWRDFQHLSNLNANNHNIQILSDVKRDSVAPSFISRGCHTSLKCKKSFAWCWKRE